ncbi:MAG: GAF domain-containing protein [Terriglobales bacterium]
MPSAVIDAAEAMATKQLNLGPNGSTNHRGLNPELDSDKTLEEITRSALHATGASGSALVLSDAEGMSCRSSSGELAPPVGTRLHTDTGFTAMCVRTAEVVRCDDTKNDPRLDGSSCAQLGIRSILAVPIFSAQKVAGVLEVLSNEPKRFTDRHVNALKLLARLVETLVDYASQGDGPPSTLTLEPKTQSNDSGTANSHQVKLTCLSCGHPNPHGSQFCNRCGVIMLSSPDYSATTPEPGGLGGGVSNSDEGLKEIYSLISGSAGRPTWNEIYPRLLAHLRSTTAQDKAAAATPKEAVKKDDGVIGFRRAQTTPELKERLGGIVRRNLWL